MPSTQRRPGSNARRTTARAILAILVTMFAHSSLPSQTCRLVADLNSTARPFSSDPDWLATCGRFVFFQANSLEHGLELWRSDGTPQGTALVRDIRPGAESSSPRWLYSCRNTAGRDVLYFAANDGVHGEELWVTDGTTNGTRMVKDIAPGTLSSEPSHIRCLGRNVYFAAYEPRTGVELWTSDGSTNGTRLVADMEPGFRGSRPQIHSLDATKSRLMMSAFRNATGIELWCTDGTTAGTRMLETRPGMASAFPITVRVVGNRTLFTATGASGNELYVTDCTPQGTRLLADIFPGPQGSEPVLWRGAMLGNELYFPAESASTGRELWKTDGTANGTRLVQDIAIGTTSSNPESIIPVGANLYFSAVTPATGREYFRFDGNSVRLIKDLRPGPLGSDAEWFMFSRGKVIFRADDGRLGRELFITDGTAAGTSLFKDIRAGTLGSAPSYVGYVPSRNFVFAANDGRNGVELWSTDGTSANTKLLKDIRPGQVTDPSIPSDFTAPWGQSLLLRADDGVAGAELWVLSPGGTQRRDLRPGRVGSWPSNFTPCWTGQRSVVFFTADDGNSGHELWAFDGSSTPSMLRDLEPGAGASRPTNLVAVNGRVVFTATTAATGRELFVSDGTSAGTRILGDLQVGPVASAPSDLVRCKGEVYFSAFRSSEGRELWATDGTSRGTRLVGDIAEGRADSDPGEFACLGDTVLFAATTPAHGRELWITDGARWLLLKDIAAGRSSSNPLDLTRCGSVVYFRATTATHGTELWVTDGTNSGTRLVRDIWPGPSGSSPDQLTCCDGTVFFSAVTATSGRELWRTDGSLAGTWLVRDVRPGLEWSSPRELTCAGRGAYFSARGRDGNRDVGRELWFTDGTARGTRLVCDAQPGSGSSNPTNLTLYGDALYFRADDGIHGEELWQLDAPGAYRRLIGQGSAGSNSVLDSTKPTLGGTAYHVYECGPGAHIGVLLFGRAVRPYGLPGVFRDGACGLVDPRLFIVAGVTATASGFIPVPIPNVLAFRGATVHTQLFWVRFLEITPFETSNAVQLVLGN